MDKENLKKQLQHKIDNIENHELLVTIMQKVEEETALYESQEHTAWKSIPQWQKDNIQKGLDDLAAGRTLTLEQFKQRLGTIK